MNGANFYAILRYRGLISCGVECDFLFGQVFDEASNMSRKF